MSNSKMFNPVISRPLKLGTKYNGNKILQFQVINPDVHGVNRGFTKDQIKNILQQQSNKYFQKYGNQYSMVGTIQYPEGYRSGYLTPVGENIQLYNHSDSDDLTPEPILFNKFFMYILKTPTAGGKSKTNDCLFEAINKLAVAYPLPASLSTPEKFKTFLFGPHRKFRNSKVDISMITKIEDELKYYKINVAGSHTRVSVKEGAPLEINLFLSGDHYYIPDSDKLFAQRGISKVERMPLIVSKDSNDLDVYDGETFFTLTRDEFKEIWTNPESCKWVIIQQDNEKTLKETYDDFIKHANMLKESSNGEVNLYKTGKIVRTALDLFYRYTPFINPDQIDFTESGWIDKATCGALISYKQYSGVGYKYDVNGEYPYLMSKPANRFPVKKGEFKRLTTEEFDNMDILPYGIYRVKITTESPNKIMFRFNPNNYYTHIDCNFAKELGYQLDIIQEDGGANALMYDYTKTLQGSHMFGRFVNTLQGCLNECDDDDKEGRSRCKNIRNCLWGALCEKNVITKKFNNDDCDDLINCNILEITPVNDYQTIFKFIKHDRPYFETRYARLKPFLLSMGRRYTAKLMLPNIENIKWVHTDGFISTHPLSLDIGLKLGQLKYEGHYPDLNITSCRVGGQFIKNN